MSSATLILALPGTGKTSLLTYFFKQRYFNDGKQLLKNCNTTLERLNRERITPFIMPEQPPMYADLTYKVKFKVGYEKWFEPYELNTYRLGVVREREIATQYVLPYGQLFIPEIQKYADSRKGTTFPASLARLFEIRRHFHLDFYMDGHKGSFIDLKVRAMCSRIIDLQYQEHDLDSLGRIICTRWYCHEFPNYATYEEYTEHGIGEYTETVYTNEGNIFEDFDSFGCEKEFIPPDGQQFSMLKPVTPEQLKALPQDVAQFYDFNEPKGWRK